MGMPPAKKVVTQLPAKKVATQLSARKVATKLPAKKIATQLTPNEIAVLKANTKFIEKEIRDWHKNFIREYPTGKLDEKQFLRVYKQYNPGRKMDHCCKYAFATFDINQDGFIDFHEFLLAISGSHQDGRNIRLGSLFDKYNASNDNHIDHKELTNLISTMYDLLGETDRQGIRDPKTRAAQIITKTDTNADGKLSRTEFIAGCKLDPVLRQLLARNS